MPHRIERNAAPRHDLEQFPRFILSESFIARSAPCERVCVCVGVGWNSVGVIYCSRGARVECTASRRLVEFAIKKIDAMEGISPEANLLLFHFARSFSLIRYSLESTLFHRQSDTVRVAFRCESLDDERGVGSISNVNLLLLPLLQ